MVANWESDVGYAWWLMENFWTNISSHYENENITSYLIYPKLTTLPKAIEQSSIIVRECDFNDRSFSNVIKLLRIIRSNHIKFLYLSDSPSYCFFYVLLRLYGVEKIVIHDHTPGERTEPSKWLSLIKSSIHRIPMYSADHFIAVTSFVHERLLKVNCIPQSKCSVAHNGIYPVNLDHADKTYAYRTFSIPDDKTIIITTGRASYYKGIDFFIQCANELVNTQGLDNLHFIFCGDGPNLDEFKALAKNLNLNNCLTFTGKRQDIKQILPSCHIGFHAAAGEVGYSLSILEYMSAGLVTIVPDNPSTSLAIKHDFDGILYQARDITDATSAIKRSLDPVMSTKIKTQGIKTVNEQFHIRDTNKQLINILSDVYQ